jgi:hypothetical protein
MTELDGKDKSTLGPATRATRPLYWVTRAGARRALIALHAIALLVVLIELAMPFDADGHGLERLHALEFPASYAIYGFIACVVLVLLGRALRRIVMRDERYYRGEG